MESCRIRENPTCSATTLFPSLAHMDKYHSQRCHWLASNAAFSATAGVLLRRKQKQMASADHLCNSKRIKEAIKQNWTEHKPLTFPDRLLYARTVVLNLYKHAEALRRFPSVCRTLFLPNIAESENGLLQGWPWLACCDITTLLAMFQMPFVQSLKQLRRTVEIRSNPDLEPLC